MSGASGITFHVARFSHFYETVPFDCFRYSPDGFRSLFDEMETLRAEFYTAKPRGDNLDKKPSPIDEKIYTVFAARKAVREGDDRRRRRDRADDSHGTDGEPAVEGRQADDAEQAGEHRPFDLPPRRRSVARYEQHGADRGEPGELHDQRDDEDRHAPRTDARAEVGEAPGEARAEREQYRGHAGTGRVAATASSWFAW